MVPVSLIYRKDKFIKGSNPLFLYGYGSYGHSIDAGFSSSRISLLDRGFVFGVDPLFEKILINADNFVKKWDGKLYFVYLPDKERYVKKNINDSKYLNRTEVLTLVSRLNIPLIDIHSDFFMKQNDPISFFAHRIYGHYSPEGYQKISEIIVNKVKEKN